MADDMIAIVGESGLQALSVRTLAARSGVSIGTVQHHFTSKEAMLAAAFERVGARVGSRLQPAATGTPRDRVRRVLGELLPLDPEREAEARVMIAFAAAATSHRRLAEIQASMLAEVVDGVARCVAGTSSRRPTDRHRATARLAVAAVDGLALHAVSAPGTLDARGLRAALRVLVEALVPD